MKDGQMNGEDVELQAALRSLAKEHEALAAGPDVEARLMRAWDVTHRRRMSRWQPFGRAALNLAAALIVTVVAGYWWTKGGVERPNGPALAVDESAALMLWPSAQSLAWLDAEPTSLQIVHVRVPSGTLGAQGYAMSDPDGDGMVEVEMIIGADGMARSVRVVSATIAIF